uniref:MIF4G domain-containing protein n=1 Tax=Nippostrongylus brasiliensis TaxID=27835 RepID=A0A0N4YUN2_NIPBR
LQIPSLLRDTVLDLLCDLHGKRNTLHPEHKINLCIFFAEVYEKIELDSGNRIDKVGEALLEQLDDLLKLDMSDSLMKTVVQLVKLCGWHLDASSVTEPLVNQLLTKMVAFAKGHPQLSEMMKNQIMSVVEVRKNGWGGNTRTNASGPDAVPSSSSLSFPRNDSGLIVGEDGVALELNEEERSFLESQFNAMDGLDDAEHDHSFDEQEVLKDFGDFVKEEEERKTSSMMEKLKVCEKDDV